MITNAIRKSIIDAYNNGHLKKDIAKLLIVNLSTVYAIIKVYLTENRVDKKLKGGQRKRSMDAVHIEALQNYIDVDCTITLEELKSNLLNDFNINVSNMAICRYIKTFNYTLKCLTLIPQRRNDEKSINDREMYAAKFYELIAEIDESHIYFVDEVGFNVSMRSKRGRSQKGKNAVQTVPGIRSRNISVCCSMTKDSVTKYDVQKSAYNTLSFNSFMLSLLEHIDKENPGKSAIVMDNVAFHKNKQIQAIIESKGDIVLLFLPPYSPFLNPIENMYMWYCFYLNKVYGQSLGFLY